jgi:hypothetical protein
MFMGEPISRLAGHMGVPLAGSGMHRGIYRLPQKKSPSKITAPQAIQASGSTAGLNSDYLCTAKWPDWLANPLAMATKLPPP